MLWVATPRHVQRWRRLSKYLKSVTSTIFYRKPSSSCWQEPERTHVYMSNSKRRDSDLGVILRRLQPLASRFDGVVCVKRTELHNIEIQKVGTQIRLVFVDPTSDEIMSRVDIDDPLNLLAVYTQAMMLALVWRPQPQRVYMIGFGGGRIPMILNHYFPRVRVESTDIEPAIREIATQFFGIRFSDRLALAVEDGRAYLARQSSDTRYDFIMMDGFRGNGYGPYHLGTRDFYDMCRAHLSEQG